MESVFGPEPELTISLPHEAEPTIILPHDASKADHVAFAQCDIYEKKGSSFRVCCRVCGFRVTTSSHKMIFGHYLRQPNVRITRCVTREKLESEHPEFAQTLKEREMSLWQKRK